ncbi:hypothetical protein [Streptomyces sp. STCH 565 A]|uniref:hypothetical protein n=1 Tax=Streptomyces sp. STCH 565 A TaxID=2950532 RepID=UPI0020755DEE|nr:hypothetical protein [Streptomyces sp. STCH 565 A]MCM8548954.1 hypothetical protein [Streptomyces sp. STCH 565 A]
MAADNVLEGIVTDALAELQRIESGVFQFGQRVRLFLQQLPADLPEPTAVTPSVTDSVDRSYLHMLVRTPDEVEAWATWLGEPVKRDEHPTAVFTSVTGTVDELRVYVGCMTLLSPQAGQAAAAEGGDC